MSAPALERMALLHRQKRAADRSAHYHFLARTRIMQGYFGAAKFYQHEAARWHERACELREQCIPSSFMIAKATAYRRLKDQLIPSGLKIAEYTGPIGHVDLSIHGSKPNASPETIRLLANG